jgi:hypothetical protein
MFVCQDHTKLTMKWIFGIPLSLSGGRCEMCGAVGPCADLPNHLVVTEAEPREFERTDQQYTLDIE